MKPILLAIVSGILLSTSYIPFYPWALFFCLVPLFSVWVGESRPLRVFMLGWICQFVFNLVGFHWIYHTAREFGHLPFVPSVIALAGFASFASLDLPLSGLFVSLIKQKFKLKPIFEISLYALGFFIVQRIYPTIFPWHLGYPWYWAHWPAIQWTDVIGFEGLSLITLLAQVLFWQIWQSRRNVFTVVRLALLFLLFFVPFNLTGKIRGESYVKQLNSSDALEFSALVVQANIGNLEKAYAEKGEGYQDYIVAQYLDLARDGLKQYPDSDIIAFPETALPISLNSDWSHKPENQAVYSFIRESQKSLITGAYSHEAPQSNPFNSVFLFNKNAELLNSYNKTHLLAFGEYIPLGDFFPILYQWMPFISHFRSGAGPHVLGWEKVNFGIQICYEGLYPQFSRGLVEKDANVFFNATNDSWFGRNFEPQQHLFMTAARSLEYRTPMIRATNTGISTVINQTGEMSAASPIYEKWHQQFKLRVYEKPERTLYARFPFVVFLLAIALFVLTLFFGRKVA